MPGETFGHVFYAINYLNNPDVYELGDRVVIIGAVAAAKQIADNMDIYMKEKYREK